MAEKQEQGTFDGRETINSALQLIRYDIPVLILGKSSIGKSYTLIDITKKWRIPHQLLYIGSEKSENIEGIPKLTERKEGKEILEYLQPYWFPNADAITKSVKNGREVFDRFIDKYWDTKSLKKFVPNIIDLTSMLHALENFEWTPEMLKSDDKYKDDVTLVDENWVEQGGAEARVLNPVKPFPVEKDGTPLDDNDDSYRRDDIADLCAYLRTVMGYGNYWLILDEIDKVEDHDKDKFAPLLHIVRERTLKNFRMIDLNDGKGAGVPLSKTFKNKGYGGIMENVNRALDAGESVLDTRVMAIANKTNNIEEALFRRFVQLIAEEVMIWRPQDLEKEQTDIGKCLDSINYKMHHEANLDTGSLIVLPKFYQRLDELNLQWEYNFFPKILNKTDLQGNYFKENAIEGYEQAMNEGKDWILAQQFTAFYNLLANNFFTGDKFNIASNLFRCFEPTLIDSSSELGINEQSIEQQIKGTRGIIANKVEDLGIELAVADIIKTLSDQYPERVQTGQNKQVLLYRWTENVIEYMNDSLYSDASTYAPLEIAEYLIPKIVGLFYGKMANDKNPVVDNFISITQTFQSFFKQLHTDEPDFNLKMDSDTTQEVMYGMTSKEIKKADQKTLDSYSADSLFGANDKAWVGSSSGKLTLMQMEDGLADALPIMLEELGEDDFVELLSEQDGMIEFMKANFTTELEQMADRYTKQSKTLNKNPDKKEAAMRFYSLAEFIKAVILQQ